MPDTSGSGKEYTVDTTSTADAALPEQSKTTKDTPVEPPLTRRLSTRFSKKLETDAAEKTPLPVSKRSSKKVEADVVEKTAQPTSTTTTRSSRKSERNAGETATQPRNAGETVTQPRNAGETATQPSVLETKSQAVQPSTSETKSQPLQPSVLEIKSQAVQPSTSETKSQPLQPSNLDSKSQAVQSNNSEPKSQAIQTSNLETISQAMHPSNSETKPQIEQLSSSETKPEAAKPSNSENNLEAAKTSTSESMSEAAKTSSSETKSEAAKTSTSQSKLEAANTSFSQSKSEAAKTSTSDTKSEAAKTSTSDTKSEAAKTSTSDTKSEAAKTSTSETKSEAVQTSYSETKPQTIQPCGLETTPESVQLSISEIKSQEKAEVKEASVEEKPADTIDSGQETPPADGEHVVHSLAQSEEAPDETVFKQTPPDASAELPNDDLPTDESDKGQIVSVSECLASNADGDLCTAVPDAVEADKGKPADAKDILPNQSLSNPFLATEAENATDNRLSWLTSTFPTFDDNMVSSVEGEAVLIVTNQTTTGMLGNSNSVAQPTEVDNKAKVHHMHVEEPDLIGKKVKKKFGKKFFEGEVVEYDPELNWYKVVYEDGDQEELDGKEVRRLVNLNELEENQAAERRKHRRNNSIANSLKRSAIKARKDGDDVSSDDDDFEESLHTQEDVEMQERKLRGLRKSLMIDTSNDGTADSADSDLGSSDEASDDNDKPAGGKRVRRIRRKGRGNRKKRRIDDNSDSEKEFGTSRPRITTRHKDDSHMKNQETPTEHRIATRRSTGSLSTPPTASDSYTSRKGSEDMQDKIKTENHTSEPPSPLGGGVKLIGRKTKKDFGGELYIGEIINYDNRVKYYKVRYEDGDEEELEWSELEPTLLPEEESQQILSLEAPLEGDHEHSRVRLRERRMSRSKPGAIVLYEGEANNGDVTGSGRKWRKKMRTASVSVMMKGTDEAVAPATPAVDSQPPPRPLATARFASASDADAFEYYGWGEVVNFERSRCPELRATRLLPTSSPIVHLVASRHHVAVLTSAGQVWVWRCKHGNIHTRCNEWEHVSTLDNRNVILVDISGPDVDRASAGYQTEQEDQVPDPFYLAAVCSNGQDIILQGSQPHEPVHTYHEPQYPGLREAFLESNPGFFEDVGNVVQVSVGMVEAADESPFIGYITDTDCVYIRSATRYYMEEVNLVTGYTGKPIKIQCGRVYHAIIMTDDGRAWTWGQGYYPGSNVISSGFASKWSSPFSVCQPAVGTLVGRKVIDVGCYGEDFIALTNDGEVHQWTHGRPNPAVGVYNVPATPVDGHGPNISSGDKLKQVTIGAGVCAGISESGKVHTWRTSMRGGFVGIVGTEREALTPLAREESYKDTTILSLGARAAAKVMCIASSLVVVVKRRIRGRRGGRKKVEPTSKGKSVQDEGTPG